MHQSRKVGWASFDGRRVRIFEALEPVTCADCGDTIDTGATFTRAVRAFRTTMPLCQSCRPFSGEAVPSPGTVAVMD